MQAAINAASKLLPQPPHAADRDNNNLLDSAGNDLRHQLGYFAAQQKAAMMWIRLAQKVLQSASDWSLWAAA